VKKATRQLDAVLAVSKEILGATVAQGENELQGNFTVASPGAHHPKTALEV
jgi:hypothetical protein